VMDLRQSVLPTSPFSAIKAQVSIDQRYAATKQEQTSPNVKSDS
jgi:hypothetical protein